MSTVNCFTKKGFIAFLEVGIKKADEKFVTKIYRKPTYTQQHINWNSNHPKNMLLGVMKGHIHRAHVICDLKEDLLEELDLLSNVFIRNGYPEKLVAKTLQESWPRETLKAVLKGVQQDVEVEKKGDYFEVLNVPYVRDFWRDYKGDKGEWELVFSPKAKRQFIRT